MESEASTKIQKLEAENCTLSQKLKTAQDMNLELWQMYQKASRRLHALEDAMADKGL